MFVNSLVEKSCKKRTRVGRDKVLETQIKTFMSVFFNLGDIQFFSIPGQSIPIPHHYQIRTFGSQMVTLNFYS